MSTWRNNMKREVVQGHEPYHNNNYNKNNKLIELIELLYLKNYTFLRPFKSLIQYQIPSRFYCMNPVYYLLIYLADNPENPPVARGAKKYEWGRFSTNPLLTFCIIY